MKMRTTIVCLLLASSVFAAPASANYFHNTAMNVHSNLGSAPNPTVRDIRERRVLASMTHAPKQPVVAQNGTRTRS